MLCYRGYRCIDLHVNGILKGQLRAYVLLVLMCKRLEASGGTFGVAEALVKCATRRG